MKGLFHPLVRYSNAWWTEWFLIPKIPWPLPVESPLIQLDNVMLLPHYASGAYEASELCCRTSAENTLEFLQTGTVKTLLNPGYIANVK